MVRFLNSLFMFPVSRFQGELNMMKVTEQQITEDFTVEVMVDNRTFSRKPDANDVKGINYRIKDGVSKLTIRELAEALENGKTFMPSKLMKKDGVLKRSISNWHSQQIVALDFDESFTLQTALHDEFFRSNAVFLYTTFSHTEELHKFRVVFVLDSVLCNYKKFEHVMTYLLTKYPQADKACKDGSRLFYGGRKVYWFNEKNRLGSQYCINESLEWDKQNNLSMSHPNPLASLKKKDTRKSKPIISSTSNIELIKNKDVQGMKQLINLEPVALKQSEIEDYLKQLNLPEFLGIDYYKSFIDIFHEEGIPSASIFKVNSGTNHWLYKCFSDSSPFLGSIIEVTTKIQQSTKEEALTFLCDVYEVSNVNAEAIEQHKQQYFQYIDYLASVTFKDDYPNLNKLLVQGKSFGALIQLLSYVSNNVSDEETIRTIAFHKVETFAKELSISKSSMGRKINFFTMLGLMKKLNNSEIDERLLKKLEQKKKENNYAYRSSVYEFPILKTEQLNEMENFATVWLENSLSIKTVTYEGIYRCFGKEKAERCFPQDKGKVISDIHDENVIKLHRVILEQVNERGWTTKKDIIESVKFNDGNAKLKKEDVLKIALKEVLDTYGLEFVPLNKKLKEEMNITQEDMSLRSFPKIVRKIQ